MRGSAGRVLLPALAVLGLVGLVAIAATGSTPSGSGETRQPSHLLLDTLLSLLLVMFVPAAAIMVYALLHREEILGEAGRRRQSGLGGIVVFVAFALLAYVWLREWRRDPSGKGIGRATPVDPSAQGQAGGPEDAYHPEFAWMPVLVILGLVALGVAAALVATRRRAKALRDEALVAETLAEVLDDTIDDLRAETDPRRAVIAAYARLERALAAHGFPRRPAETQLEYVGRILGDLDVDRRSVRRLADLFTQAKFSQHEVDAAMKEEAIDTLEEVRDELRAAEARGELPADTLRAGEEPA